VRSLACTLAWLVTVAAPLLLTCDKPMDWTKFDSRSVEGSVVAVLAADSIYHELATSDRSEAALQTVAFLGTQECCADAGVTPDTTVWVWFRNGMVGIISLPPAGVMLSAHEHRQAQAAAGEVPGPYIVLSPFRKYWDPGNGEPDSDYSDELVTLLEQTLGPSAQVTKWYDDDVTVEKVRQAVSAGFLYWCSHGERVPLPPDSTMVTGLVLGEWWDAQTASGRILQLSAAGYRFAGDTGSSQPHFAIRTLEGEVYFDVLPGFFSDFANFAGQEIGARDRSIVYLSCCFGAGIKSAAMANGADAFFGWTDSPWSPEARTIDSTILTRICDSMTIGEALAGANRTSDQAFLDFAGDADVMVRSKCSLVVAGAAQQFFLVVADRGSTVTIAAQDATPSPGQVTMTFPSGLGTYLLPQADDAMLVWYDIPQGRYYMAGNDMQGVSGTITIDRLDDAVISGTFSGTLGWWQTGHDPSQDPPDATTEVGSGWFKYAGE
jgi:hypothetical protein